MRARLGLAVLAVPVLALAADEAGRSSVAAARDLAGEIHEVFADTLKVVGGPPALLPPGRVVLPSRVLWDVSTRLDRRAGVKAKWTAVNTAAMSVTRLSNTAASPHAKVNVALDSQAETDTAFSTSRLDKLSIAFAAGSAGRRG